MIDGTYSQSELIYKPGDTVKVRVDSKKRTIAFEVNQSGFRTLAKIRESVNPYFLAVQLYYNGGLSLVRYSGPQRDAEESKEPENNVCSFHF